LGLLTTITLEVDPFSIYALFSVLLPFLKCILEAVLCEGVQYRLWFCLNHLFFCVKVGVFSFIFNQGNKEKVVGAKQVDRDKNNVFLGKNSLVKKEV
jgi:hypothetical protein